MSKMEQAMKRGDVRLEDLADYCDQLARMLEAGVSLRESLEILQHGWEQASMRRLATGLCRRVGEGRRLSEALADAPRSFAPFLVAAIAQAEKEDTLVQTLAETGQYLLATAALDTGRSGALRSTLYYPAAVLSVMLLITAVLLLFVIPQFEMLFDNFGAELPALTRLVIDIANGVQRWWPLLLGLLVVLLPLWRLGMRRSAPFHALNIRLLSRLPGYGPIYLQSRAARLLHTWGFLLGRGMNLQQAVAASAQLPLGPYYRNRLQGLAAKMPGESLQGLLAQEWVLPGRVAQAMAVAERIRQPQLLLQRLADGYAAQLQKRLKVVASQQEVVLISLIAVVIGTLVIAMYLPIFMLGKVV